MTAGCFPRFLSGVRKRIGIILVLLSLSSATLPLPGYGRVAVTRPEPVRTHSADAVFRDSVSGRPEIRSGARKRTDSRALPRIADRGVLACLGTGFDVSGNSGQNTGFNDDFCETPLESQIQQSACCGHVTVTGPSDGHEAQPQFRRIYVNAVANPDNTYM